MDWTQVKIASGAAGAVIVTALAQVLGGWDIWLQGLVLMVVLDYVSGLCAAATQGKLNSSVAAKGIPKKILIFVIVAAAVWVDKAFGADMVRMVAIGSYVGMEALSIIENADRAGLPVPEKLKVMFEQMRGNSNADHPGQQP